MRRAVSNKLAQSAGLLLAAIMASSADSADADQQSATMHIERRWVVRTPSKGRGKYWVANTKDDGQGRPYIKLQKFDRSFVWFCLRKGMRVGESECSANVSQFDELIARRKAASIAAVHRALESEGGENPDKKAKKRKIREEDSSLVDDHVVIELDEIQVGSKQIGGFGARVLWGLDSSTLWLELTETNLEYMRQLVSQGQEKKGKTHKLRRLKRFMSSPKAAPKASAKAKAAAVKSAPRAPKEESRPVVDLPDTLPYPSSPIEVPPVEFDAGEVWTDAQPRSPFTPVRDEDEEATQIDVSS